MTFKMQLLEIDWVLGMREKRAMDRACELFPRRSSIVGDQYE
jgi:hypothetical protein